MRSRIAPRSLALLLPFPLLMLLLIVPPLPAEPAAPAVKVEVEEVVATCRPPDNGAGPLWCYGAPLITRLGQRVFVSVMETGAGVPPLCNTRWRLFARDDNAAAAAAGWKLLRQPDGFRHREPCPLAAVGPNQLVLSVNPSTQPPGTKYGACDPHLIRFDLGQTGGEPAETELRPPWPAKTQFTDHSYRGFAADARRGEVLALNIDAQTSAQHWALGKSDGTFLRTGAITFPIRSCYPQVAMREGAAHVLAIGDIVEPNQAWRTFKKERTGRDWDYVFRRLFHTWTPNLAQRDFAPPVEIDTVEAGGGHIINLDLWIDPAGTAHVLYLKTNLSWQLRDRFFPGQKVTTTLEHVEISRGKVSRRATLLSGGERARETPHYARFHIGPEGALSVVAAVSGRRPGGSSFRENRLLALRPGPARSVVLPLKTPLTTFFTATERGGTLPSTTLDLFGVASDDETLRYARVRLPAPGTVAARSAKPST